MTTMTSTSAAAAAATLQSALHQQIVYCERRRSRAIDRLIARHDEAARRWSCAWQAAADRRRRRLAMLGLP